MTCTMVVRRLTNASIGAAAFAALAALVAGCGAAARTGGLPFSGSHKVASCETSRTHEPGGVDTVDVGWLHKPMRIISYADPVYPQAALTAGQNAEMKLRVIIAPDGKVAKILGVTGPANFREPAIAAVRAAELTSPTQLYGRPTAVCATLNLSFQAVHGGVAWLNISSH